ncbi:MAG: polyphenol oxidase family protein [Vicinamibacterales bacterium]
MDIPRPQPSGSFRWTQEPWGAALQCAPLAAVAPHLFTSRALTLRDRDDEWAAVAASMEVAIEDLLLVKQVHAAEVAVASRSRPRPWRRPEADVIVTDDPTAAIGVRVADCVPILMAEDSGRAVAAVHAGWRGMAARAAIAAVQALQERHGIRPARLVVAVGPSIGPCCYEVGETTHSAFRQAGHHDGLLDRWFEPRAAGTLHLDLWRAARDQLEGAGVLPANIHTADLCTKTHAGVFHSRRADGDRAGRMLAAIRLRPSTRFARSGRAGSES